MRLPIFIAASGLTLSIGCSPTPAPGSEPEPESVSTDSIYGYRQIDVPPSSEMCQEPNGRPNYTEDNENYMGSVRIRFVLGKDGRPEPESIVIESGANGRVDWRTLQEAARRRLLGCEWSNAAMKDGKPVRVRWYYTAYLEGDL